MLVLFSGRVTNPPLRPQQNKLHFGDGYLMLMMVPMSMGLQEVWDDHHQVGGRLFGR